VSKSSIHAKFDEQAFVCFEAIEHCLLTTQIVLFLLTLVWELVLSGSIGWQTLQLSIKLKIKAKSQNETLPGSRHPSQ
jgi:hypothetical protein